ncbi:MAG: PD40 domain-containing protein, partial [Flavobacteriales bacterium]|nr:PD40 domain-containing protein [Flavobacteriales bacterium]
MWTFNPSTKEYKQLTTFTGEDRNPIFSKDGNTIVLPHRGEGSFNVRKMPAAGGASTQVSRFADHPVRYLSTSDGGVLWLQLSR